MIYKTIKEWFAEPLETRIKILENRGINCLDKYIAVNKRLAQRYYEKGKGLTITIKGKPSRYKILDNLAYLRYMVNGGNR